MAVRQFTDPRGRVWQVWNVTPGRHTMSGRQAASLPEEMAEGWLCFECGDEKRRFGMLPEGWAELNDAELWVLCRAAVGVRVPRPAAVQEQA